MTYLKGKDATKEFMAFCENTSDGIIMILDKELRKLPQYQLKTNYLMNAIIAATAKLIMASDKPVEDFPMDGFVAHLENYIETHRGIAHELKKMVGAPNYRH